MRRAQRLWRTIWNRSELTRMAWPSFGTAPLTADQADCNIAARSLKEPTIVSDIQARSALLKRIEDARASKAVLYATGDRDGLETRIGQDVIDLFVDHLDDIGRYDESH